VPKSKRYALAALVLFVALCGAWLLSLDHREHFTTDVAELLPEDERDPEARLALSLVHQRQGRVFLVALDAPAGTPASALANAGRVHAETLLASPAFVSAYPLAGQSWQQALGRLLHSRRFDLLLPGWLAEHRKAYASEKITTPFPKWLAARAVAALDVHLASPSAAATEDLVSSDPLLLLVSVAEQNASLSPAPAASPTRVLIWAETRDEPLTEAGQQPVFDALDAAATAARAHVPELNARFTGVARFAAAAKASTRAEVTRLNAVAIACVLFLTALFLRRFLALLHILPVVLIASLGATAVTTLVFPRVHVLVFVLGSLLSGVAVDYAFQLVLARRENETYAARLRRLTLPLLGGAGTTFAGFLALVLSELPLVRQLGVYVAAGIVVGLGATVLYFSLFPRLNLAPRNLTLRTDLPFRLRTPILFALTGFALFGLTHLRWHDDLRTLEYPSPDLRVEDAALRSAFGQTDEGATFLTRGATYAEARTRWQHLADSAPPDASVTSIASLLPSPDVYASATSDETRAQLTAFVPAFRSAAEAAGFEPDAFDAFYRDFSAYLSATPSAYETLLGETLATLPGPLALLAHSDAEGVWFLSTAPRAFEVPAVAEGTWSLSGIEGLNHLFARYRAATARLSLIGILALVVISCALQGLRLGLRTASLPLLATGLAFAVLALRGDAFSLFHLLGALLGVCLADDYAHFAHADDPAYPQARAAIRLSGLTTAASFAVLMTSAIPAVSALGTTVALIVLLALVFVETDLFSLRRHA
jgi:predicted exporter